MNKKIKTEWDLGLMYKSPKDPALEKDALEIDRAFSSFAKKYGKNRAYLSDAKKLKQAIEEYEALDELPYPLIYLHLYLDIHSGDADAEAMRNKLSQLLTASGNKLLFFRIALGSIPPKKQKEFLCDPSLAEFSYFLRLIFMHGKYRLSEAEEKIMNLKSLPAHGLWVEGQEKLLAGQTVLWEGKQISLGEASNKVHTLPKAKRRELSAKIIALLKSLSHFAESEMNAIVIDKKISDELRGYKMPYSATILGYQNDEKSVLGLVDTVTKNFKIAHRYYALKAKMLGLKKMKYADRAAAIGETRKKVPFVEGLKILRRAFEHLGGKYLKFLDRYLENGQVDVFPHKGKKSGAYCWSNANRPTYVLLNYTDSNDSVMTFAHEMGHAIHGELSKSQCLLYQGHTISVAEVASTLFENFAFEEIFEHMSDAEKIIALHDRIGDDMQTIFRQVSFFNFETELHMKIREKGSLSKEEMAELMNKHARACFGPIFELGPDDGYSFVGVLHFRRFFYVYSYAYGQLVSKALYRNYKKDRGYLAKIETFLSAGESMSPEDIFKKIGIDTSKPAFFLDGLKSIEEDIKRLEKLVAKKSKKKTAR